MKPGELYQLDDSSFVMVVEMLDKDYKVGLERRFLHIDLASKQVAVGTSEVTAQFLHCMRAVPIKGVLERLDELSSGD